MLSPPDLSGFDLDDLSANLLLLTQRQHRCLRQANDLVEVEGRPGIASEIDNLDRDAASAAEAHRLVSVIRRFVADEGHARPRLGIFARTMALLGRGEPAFAPLSKKDAA